jgi:bifunctional DNA-binding transcriptional regulator/antitoxin component of YhaV-PrlF toxin-antitoxin module
VVPRAIRRKAGFKSGQELEIKASGGVITIVPKLPGAADEYTPAERRAIDRGIARSEKEYREGKHAGPFNTADEFLADLHRESTKLGAKRKPVRKWT